MYPPSSMTFTRLSAKELFLAQVHCMFAFLQKLSNNTSAQAFLGPENAEVSATLSYITHYALLCVYKVVHILGVRLCG